MPEPLAPLSVAQAVICGWLLVGAGGLLRPRSIALASRVLFPLGVAGSLVIACAGLAGLDAPASTAALPFGLPQLPIQLRLDPLAAFFLCLLGVASTGISLFGAGYFRTGEGSSPGLLCLQYHVFLASMALVVLADDAYGFLAGWEVMALASCFLVTSQHRLDTIRSAGFLYLLLAHLGALAILLAFGLLQNGDWRLDFAALRAAEPDAARATLVFLLALLGFGAKAGLAPLHVWLPEAHPAAPSPVSALMSGVMLKTAVYGMLRLSLDLLPQPFWYWGAALLSIGLFSAIFGAVFAAVQTDMKRLLAYSSIENLGIVFAGCGLTLLFHAEHMRLAAALALTATLYHCLNHAVFKSLLFLATGSVLHATGERNLGRLGGLIRRMPWVAWLALIGTLAIAGLPPLNGFVSEWLLLQAFLLTPDVPRPFMNMLVPLGASLLALTVALGAYVMVKFYGVVFLGRMREPALAQARDCGRLERLGLLWLAVACVLLGLLPTFILRLLDGVNDSLLGIALAQAGASHWTLIPVSAERASYSPLLFFFGGALALGVSMLVATRVYRRQMRRAAAWDCGFGHQDARMQDTAEGFGQPIRHIFTPFFSMQRELPSPFDTAPAYRIEIEDRFWKQLYLPMGRVFMLAARRLGQLQQGRIAVYLLYSFLTLLVLLVMVLWT